MSQIKKVRTGQRFNIDLWDPSNVKTPKYSLNIVDSKNKKTLENVIPIHIKLNPFL